MRLENCSSLELSDILHVVHFSLTVSLSVYHGGLALVNFDISFNRCSSHGLHRLGKRQMLTSADNE